MSAEIDKGPIIVQRKLELEPCEHSINSTMYALVDAATELFRENWACYQKGTFALKATDALGEDFNVLGSPITRILLGKSTERDEPGLCRLQLQVECRQAFTQNVLNPKSVPAIPETQHKVIDVPQQVGFAPQAGA